MSEQDAAAIKAEGLGDEDIAAITAHLDLLRRNGLVPTRPQILEPLLEAQGARATAMNLAQAQEVYFRGIALALAQTERRWRGAAPDASDFVTQLLRGAVGERLAALAAVSPPAQAFNPAPITQADVPTYAPAPPLEPIIAAQMTSPGSAPQPEDHVEYGIVDLGLVLARKRKAERNWDDKTVSQATRLYALLERFLAEEYGIKQFSRLRQAHLGKFGDFLQFEIHPHYGKGTKDRFKTISELRAMGRKKPPDERGVKATTLNRHLNCLQQLIDFARSRGVQIPGDLGARLLRSREARDDRPRNARATLDLQAAARIFKAPAFTDCLAWSKPHKSGGGLWHRALYYVPMLLYYHGGRREEFCGLTPDDIIQAKGTHPYIHISRNEIRRVKNAASVRNVPLHPELIRLGFLNYVAAIKALGYTHLFPDLYSPGTTSKLGDRFYKEFKPILVDADADEKGLVVHSMRRGFGNALKQARVTEEERGDLL